MANLNNTCNFFSENIFFGAINSLIACENSDIYSIGYGEFVKLCHIMNSTGLNFQWTMIMDSKRVKSLLQDDKKIGEIYKSKCERISKMKDNIEPDHSLSLCEILEPPPVSFVSIIKNDVMELITKFLEDIELKELSDHIDLNRHN